MPNQITVIAPDWLDEAGTWVFDDSASDLKQESFVEGVSEMIDRLVADEDWGLMCYPPQRKAGLLRLQ